MMHSEKQDPSMTAFLAKLVDHAQENPSEAKKPKNGSIINRFSHIAMIDPQTQSNITKPAVLREARSGVISKWPLLNNELEYWQRLYNVKELINCMSRVCLLVNKISEVGQELCAFCRNNGETKEFYSSHKTRDEYGNVCCPLLSKLTCPLCGFTGEKAHTLKYCPLKRCKRDIVLQ